MKERKRQNIFIAGDRIAAEALASERYEATDDDLPSTLWTEEEFWEKECEVSDS